MKEVASMSAGPREAERYSPRPRPETWKSPPAVCPLPSPSFSLETGEQMALPASHLGWETGGSLTFE